MFGKREKLPNDMVEELKRKRKSLRKEKEELLSKSESLKRQLKVKEEDFRVIKNLLDEHNRPEITNVLCLLGTFLSLFLFLSGMFALLFLFSVEACLWLEFLGGVIALLSYYILSGTERDAAMLNIKIQKTFEEIERLRSRITSIQRMVNDIDSNIRDINTEIKMRKKGLVPFIDRLGRKRFGTPKHVRKWKTMDMDMKNRFSRLKPREFEKLIRSLFIKMGYEASLTPYIADFGADIVAKKGKDTVVIQVKKYSGNNKVGSPEIQRVLGSMFKYKANKAIFITTSDFTREAREQARDTPIELWNYKVLNEKIDKYILDS